MATERVDSDYTGSQPAPENGAEISHSIPWSVDGPHGTDQNSRNINQPNFPWCVDGSLEIHSSNEGFIVPDHGSPIRPRDEYDPHFAPNTNKKETEIVDLSKLNPNY